MRPVYRRPVGSRRSFSRPHRQAFTLIELLLVMVILAILAAVIVPSFTNRSQQARESRAVTDIASLKTVIQAYEVDTGAFPTSLQDLMTNPGGSVQGWHGPYLHDEPKDPWGHDYIYHPPAGGDEGGSYTVISAGPDGQEGTADDLPKATSK